MNHRIRKRDCEELAARFYPEVVEIRRHLHMYPELSFQESQTAAFISRQLRGMGIPFREQIGGHGIVALINPEKSKQGVIALRADFDALPIQEENQVSYASRVPGVMHACGHDVHTACLLGAARILMVLQQEIDGCVKLIFQPAEEKLPGGASLMIRDGALQDPVPQGIVALHVYPSMEAGRVGFRSGPYMASADELYFMVKGTGGHAALPAETRSPILAAADLVQALQQIQVAARERNIPTVLSIGRIWSEGGATNVIPETVFLEGTLRTLEEAWRSAVHDQIQGICQDISSRHQVRCEPRIEKGYPFLVNDPELTARMRRSAAAFLGEDQVEELPLRMTAEDFAWYSQQLPACFFRLGTGNRGRGITSGVHTPTFDIDEEALRIGSGLMAWLAIQGLSEE